MIAHEKQEELHSPTIKYSQNLTSPFFSIQVEKASKVTLFPPLVKREERCRFEISAASHSPQNLTQSVYSMYVPSVDSTPNNTEIITKTFSKKRFDKN